MGEAFVADVAVGLLDSDADARLSPEHNCGVGLEDGEASEKVGESDSVLEDRRLEVCV
jgi:hypothetical protein